MDGSRGRRAMRAAARLFVRPDALLVAACAIALAGCNQNGASTMAAAPRGATVAFESIDGPPPAQFRTLVQNLNDEAQTRRLAVISREQPSAYRVRGYLAAHVVQGRTTISWVWDVFDRDENRALRIAGEEIAKGRPHDAWTLADNAMMQRIARSSMDQLARFLTSPEVTPNAPAPAVPEGTLMSANDASPEAAGIFRIPQAKADPISGSRGDAPGPVATIEDSVGAIPLPRRRPEPAAVVSTRETLSLSALSR